MFQTAGDTIWIPHRGLLFIIRPTEKHSPPSLAVYIGTPDVRTQELGAVVILSGPHNASKGGTTIHLKRNTSTHLGGGVDCLSPPILYNGVDWLPAKK